MIYLRAELEAEILRLRLTLIFKLDLILFRAFAAFGLAVRFRS